LRARRASQPIGQAASAALNWPADRVIHRAARPLYQTPSHSPCRPEC
jgi:hypothetical protein